MNNPSPSISIVILNWNGLKDTLPCLRSVFNIRYPDFEVIVADNGSEDESVEVIRRQFPQVILLENKENLGFAEGNNRAIEVALRRGAEYIVLLNNDTEVDPGILAAFAQAAMAHPGCGLFAARIFFFDEPRRLFYRGAKFIWQLAGFLHIGHHDLETNESEAVEDTGFASGCALLASAKMIRDIGPLDSRFYLNWEDIEWSTRSISRGYGCKLVPKAIVYHKVSASFVGGAQGAHHRYYFARNQLLWIRLHLGRRFVASLLAKVIGWRILRDIGTFFNPLASSAARRSARAGLHGVLDFFLGRFGRGPQWLESKTRTASSPNVNSALPKRSP